MEVLILGGTGNISHHFVSQVLSRGWKVTTVTRGSSHSGRRQVYHQNKTDLFGDIRSPGALLKIVPGKVYFDVVVNFICYDESDAAECINYLKDRVGHYLFISTTAGYSKRPEYLPYTETTPFTSLNWEYCRKKAEAEAAYMTAFEQFNFPVTIARLSHTFDTVVPVAVGPADWTIPQRILDGKQVVVHGDGTTCWTILHSSDAAEALVRLCLSEEAFGQVVNVVSDVRITWLDLTSQLFEILGMPARVCHVPSQNISRVCPYLGNGIIGHKMWNDFYDSTKLKTIIGGWHPGIGITDGLQRTVDWYQADIKRQHIDKDLDKILDQLCIASILEN